MHLNIFRAKSSDLVSRHSNKTLTIVDRGRKSLCIPFPGSVGQRTMQVLPFPKSIEYCNIWSGLWNWWRKHVGGTSGLFCHLIWWPCRFKLYMALFILGGMVLCRYYGSHYDPRSQGLWIVPFVVALLVSSAATARLDRLSSAQCIGSFQSRVHNIHGLVSRQWCRFLVDIQGDGDGK